MRFRRFFQRNHTFFSASYTTSSRPPRPRTGDHGNILWRRKGYCMQLDKKSMDRLLKLNDEQLRAVIGKLLTEYGVDISRVPLATMDMTALRSILQLAGETDMAKLLQALGGGQPK